MCRRACRVHHHNRPVDAACLVLMAPKKRKVAVESAQHGIAVDPEHVALLNKRLQEIDAAVEEKCEAIKAAADDAVAKLMQQLQMQLLQLPKKVRSMSYKEYMAAQQQDSTAVPDAAAALVDSKLVAVQQQSVAAATAAPTTRSLRSRARAATAAVAEPRTTRSTRSRQAVAAAAPKPAVDAAGELQETADHAGLQSQPCVDSPPQPAAAGSEVAAAAAAAPTADADAKRTAALDRAQAKVDAKLAALGLAAAGTAARGAARTVQRAAKPGEACFSKNGSPLSIHPNITRNRGRTIATSLMTPALQAAPAGTSMVGCITLIKKQPAATGAAAATGRSKRSRAAVAAAEEQTPADGTAMMVTTDDGNTFTVDAAAGGVDAVPAAYKEEVAAKLRAIQQLATAALGSRA